jgi:hypothetical protein
MVGDIAQNDIDNIAKFVALFESFLSNLKDAAGINGLCRDVYSTDDFPADMLNKIQEILDKMYNAYKFLKGLLIEIGDNINGSDQDNDDFEGNINFLIKANKK